MNAQSREGFPTLRLRRKRGGRTLSPRVMTRVLIAFGLAAAMVGMATAAPQPPEPPPFERPAPPPSQVSSSEGMPPLPYPAVFQKRQERKNPPQPPVLLTKIRTPDPEDWARVPHDMKGLLQTLSREMGVSFSSNIKPLKEVSTDPAQNPVLYRSGYKPFTLTREQAGCLREYLLNGGTIIFNSLVGHPDFYQSALKAARDIFPDRPVSRLRMDHPLFHAYHEIGQVKYRERMVRDGMGDGLPHFDGVDLDNRTAILISRWDLALGWDANAHESWGYADVDARRLGANLVCYVTAMREAGRSVGKTVELADADRRSASKFRVGQVTYDGLWRTRAAAFPMLLSQFHEVTGTPVSFDLRPVALTDGALFEYPFLYLTGTTDFQLNGAERARLTQFLANGGTLFAEAGEGRPSFDMAFRHEMGAIFPEHPLVRIPPEHALFAQPNAVGAVRARPALAHRLEDKAEVPPELYGIEVNGSLVVIYSPKDLSAGWERAVAPYAFGYESADATRLGVNILFHAMAH
jgi:hypothetical protein